MAAPKRITTGIQVPADGQLKPKYNRQLEQMYERMRELTPSNFDLVLKVIPKSKNRKSLKIKKA